MKKSLIYFLVFLFLLVLVFHNLLKNPASALLDWRDYPYYVWVVQQNLGHITNLDFANFFNTNAFYPNANTLLLSDTLLPQSLIALPFSLFLSNPILIFNITFLITFILNYVSSFLFWKEIFKRRRIAFLGALLVIFSPFVHIELGHFQMISFWPYFFAMYFLVRSSGGKAKNAAIVGLFLSLQFLASVYISIFLIISIILYIALKALYTKDKLVLAKKAAIIFITFVLLDGVFIKGYLDTQKMYDIKRDYSEYVQYSAHISDYLFTTNFISPLHKTQISNRWNDFDKHKGGATSAGILLTSLSILGLLAVRRSKHRFNISLSLTHERLFFLVLAVTGIILSLGPRIGFNGVYAHIPLPYHFLIKYVPLFDIIRATSRWSYLFYVGTIYFALSFINSTKGRGALVLVFTVILIEYIPFSVPTYTDTYLDQSDQVLLTECKEGNTVVLEVPITHFDGKGTITDGLSRVTKNQLASTYHGCSLVNGYSGYDLPSIQNLKDEVYEYLANGNLENLTTLLSNKGVDILLVNRDSLDETSLANYLQLLPSIERSSAFSKIGPDMFAIHK